MKKVAVIMGSDSDLPVVAPAIKQLRELSIETEVHVMSAHRTPRRLWPLQRAPGRTALA